MYENISNLYEVARPPLFSLIFYSDGIEEREEENRKFRQEKMELQNNLPSLSSCQINKIGHGWKKEQAARKMKRRKRVAAAEEKTL